METWNIFCPQTSTANKPTLWLGDGFVNKELNNTLYIFVTSRETGAGVFDFIEPGVSILLYLKEATLHLQTRDKSKPH